MELASDGLPGKGEPHRSKLRRDSDLACSILGKDPERFAVEKKITFRFDFHNLITI